jgi:hypothetical protein
MLPLEHRGETVKLGKHDGKHVFGYVYGMDAARSGKYDLGFEKGLIMDLIHTGGVKLHPAQIGNPLWKWQISTECVENLDFLP